MKKSSAAVSIIAGIIIAALLSLVVSADIALFAGFIFAIALLIYSDRKKVKLEGVVFIRRTQKGRSFIDKTAKSHPLFWKRLSSVGIVLSVVLLVAGSLVLVTQAHAVISGAKDGGVKLLLPGPVSTPVNVPGVFVVPWWIWVIGIAVVIIPHEFMHGIMCRIDGIRIKSVGWLLLFIIPGAFVEPDEKQLKKASKKTKLRVYAAGSFANMLVAGIILVIAFLVSFSLAASSTIEPNGLFISTLKDSPAYNASLNGTIIAINDIAVKNHPQLTAELSKYKNGDAIKVTTAETYFISGFLPPHVINEDNANTKLVTLGKHPERGAFLGVRVEDQSVELKMNLGTYAVISLLTFWLFIFSFGIGLVNLLPIKPLDGGLIFEELVGGRKRLVYGVSLLMLFLLVFNLVGPLILG